MNETEKKQEALKDFLATMVAIARTEGNRIRETEGREPTAQEAENISAMIIKQAKTAVAMTR